MNVTCFGLVKSDYNPDFGDRKKVATEHGLFLLENQHSASVGDVAEVSYYPDDQFATVIRVVVVHGVSA